MAITQCCLEAAGGRMSSLHTTFPSLPDTYSCGLLCACSGINTPSQITNCFNSLVWGDEGLGGNGEKKKKNHFKSHMDGFLLGY